MASLSKSIKYIKMAMPIIAIMSFIVFTPYDIMKVSGEVSLSLHRSLIVFVFDDAYDLRAFLFF